ncbi:MAG: sialate O-acetylesterase [Cyclobacteriaceae bacterium]|nr:sialate O-acetylesterase [Cyclobacteriaceae bacterium]UYN85564.1 MAG: sialate O-acetylesterase [Cyclobacteriaceae bacterium]
MNYRIKLFLTTILIAFVGLAKANVILPAIFSDHMVLQQNTSITIWGWAKALEEVKITVSWDSSKEYKKVTDVSSYWSFNIETPKAGGPYQITIQGYNTIIIDDVLIGEVWLGSGQSNMEWTPAMKIDGGEDEKTKANYPQIRFFTVLPWADSILQKHLTGKWVVCTPESMYHFSALMYFFGREIHSKRNVPVGLICSAWGGSPAEVWMHESIIEGNQTLKQSAEMLKPVSWSPIKPGSLFNTMVYPLAPYKIKGALWYQGEANTSNAIHYQQTLTTLIKNWREAWDYEFPFYIVQIAPWSGYGRDNVNGAIVRDQQRKVANSVPQTGLVVVSDIGNLEDIHPRNKLDVGRRLAAWALHHDYGVAIPFSGPLYQTHEIKKDKVIIHFRYSEEGLISKDGKLKEFEIYDGKQWHSMPAKINGATVEVSTKNISTIKGIRYAYKNDSNPNLFNKAALPASCFEVLIDR